MKCGCGKTPDYDCDHAGHEIAWCSCGVKVEVYQGDIAAEFEKKSDRKYKNKADV